MEIDIHWVHFEPKMNSNRKLSQLSQYTALRLLNGQTLGGLPDDVYQTAG